MEQVKQKKQPASSVPWKTDTRQEQYHDEQTSKQSNIQTSYKESQQAKQESVQQLSPIFQVQKWNAKAIPFKKKNRSKASNFNHYSR